MAEDPSAGSAAGRAGAAASDRAARRSSSVDAVERALRERPAISVRFRIGASFLVCFLITCGAIAGAMVLLHQLTRKQEVLETATKFAFECQQARRYEKNFFLYGTHPHFALDHALTAAEMLGTSADDLGVVFSREELDHTRSHLQQYVRLLEDMVALAERDERAAARERGLDAAIRETGTAMESKLDVVERERASVRALLNASMVVASSFLVLTLVFMALLAWFLSRIVLKPLGRFVRYTERIAKGDFTPITPARKYKDEFTRLATAINRMLRELEVRQEELTQTRKIAAIGTLTAGIAHELNNPLNNISLTTEALLDDFSAYDDEQKVQMLRDIFKQVERASATVRNLLDFTRSGRPESTRLCVGDVVESALGLLHHEIELNDVDVDLALGSGPERCHVLASQRDLQQVMVNLLLNAVQAMPGGGRLTVRVCRQEGTVRVDVADTGTGIPPDVLDKIFDPFFTTKEVGKGTGLGLSVSHGIVEKHGGRLTVRSDVGKGTTFSIVLPCADATRRQQPQGEQQEETAKR